MSFEQTDVSASGNGPILSLSRRFELPSQSEQFNLLDNAFGNWDIELPRVTTITLNQFNANGWLVASGNPKAICTQFNAPPSVTPPKGDNTRPWDVYQWWHGYQLIIPGQGSQDLLRRNSANTLAPQISGMSFPLVTKQNWAVSCLAQAENDSTREAFLAIAPDGTRYWFNHLAYRWLPAISREVGNQLARREGSMLVTRIEDRFGNYLTYTYDASNRLASIAASDGRALSVQYADSTPLIRSVTLQPTNSAARTWTYNYARAAGDGPGVTELNSVVLPDGSAWRFDLAALTHGALVDITETASICNTIATPHNLGTSYTGSITHPSGLTGTFTVTPVKRGRSYVYRNCWNATVNGANTPTSPNSFALVPNAWYGMAITQRQYAGAGMPPRTWTYAYSPANESWTADSCASAGTCATTVWTNETDPAGNGIRHTFSNRYDASESSLQRADYYNGAPGGTLMRSETSAYASPTVGPWPTSWGNSLQTNVNDAQITQLAPLNQRTLVQDGDTYTWQAEAFDAFAQVTRTRRSNSIDGQQPIEETTTYLNDTNLWVLGLPLQVTNVATGEVESANTYDSNYDTLQSRARFGQTLMTYTFDANGNLASFTDGNAHTTTLANYKRGIPQSITYPNTWFETLAVDDFGQIASLTDQAGATTGYSYDPVGRLTRITYPTGDEQAWLPKAFTYTYVTTAERGLEAGHWRRTVATGNAQSVTYFDAMLRPVLSDSSIVGNSGSDTTALTNYDWKGQKTFASYAQGTPVNFTTNPASAGILGSRSTYDALGRLTQSQQDSELGALTTTTAYLSGARMQVTDPKGNVTTTAYQVFDQPAYDAVIQVQAPTGLTQTITRDVYGNPLAIAQSGQYNGVGVGVTKTLTYDSYHRLCRTTEPESGSEVMAYDGANNIA